VVVPSPLVKWGCLCYLKAQKKKREKKLENLRGGRTTPNGLKGMGLTTPAFFLYIYIYIDFFKFLLQMTHHIMSGADGRDLLFFLALKMN
jgi:hypothetical protein